MSTALMEGFHFLILGVRMSPSTELTVPRPVATGGSQTRLNVMRVPSVPTQEPLPNVGLPISVNLNDLNLDGQLLSPTSHMVSVQQPRVASGCRLGWGRHRTLPASQEGPWTCPPVPSISSNLCTFVFQACNKISDYQCRRDVLTCTCGSCLFILECTHACT